MSWILYIDLFFLWNFWMNALTLFVVRQITKTYRTLQCLTSAAIGAFSACLALVWYIKQESYIIIFLTEGAVLIMMCLLTFGCKNLLWHLFLLIISMTTTAGLFLYLSSFVGIEMNSVSGIVVSVVAGLFCIVLEKQSRIRWKEEHMKVKTVLEFEDKKLFTTALMDTGNKLYDPFYHKPVILVDEKLIAEMLVYCKEKHPEKMHYIPFHSVGKDNGLLEGITLDYVSIKWQSKNMRFREVIAAATKETLYKGKEYQVIFHCGLLQEG